VKDCAAVVAPDKASVSEKLLPSELLWGALHVPVSRKEVGAIINGLAGPQPAPMQNLKEK